MGLASLNQFPTWHGCPTVSYLGVLVNPESFPEQRNKYMALHCPTWRREWLPTPVFLLGESHGQGSLVSYSPGVAKNWTHLSIVPDPSYWQQVKIHLDHPRQWEDGLSELAFVPSPLRPFMPLFINRRSTLTTDFFFFFGYACCMRDLSSPTRDWACGPCIESMESKHWITREVPHHKILK